MREQLFFTLFALLAVAAGGCTFEQRTTALHMVHEERPDMIEQRPVGVWTLRILEAMVPRSKQSGLEWDQDGTAPDPFVRLYVGGRMVWESKMVENSYAPRWNVTLPRNIQVNPDASFRLEIWDRDTPVSADPIGRLKSIGLPPLAQPDAVARLTLDTGAIVTVLVSPPRAHQGTGVLKYEVHRECLYVLEVEKLSPAGRAGIRKGDHITGIDGLRVSTLNTTQSATLLSLAAKRGYVLDVADDNNVERKVRLDRGYTWLTM
jgi:hypothetical protein